MHDLERSEPHDNVLRI